MTQAIELKKGMIFSQDGKLIEVLKSNHHKPGKGNTVMQMDLRDVMSGAVVHKTMRPTEKVDLVEVSLVKSQYLYDDETNYIFMDTNTYEQYMIPKEHLEAESKFLMPNIDVDLKFTSDGKLIGINLPSTVTMKVVETQPGIKGATAAAGGKPATMETGLVVTVPDFIKEGEELVIGTENGDYKARADKF
ncbi:elongation factor P [Lactobacillus colini]|uniref:Elongation factor P n=1 Tax=Lactobacillus colini TaxID=1819254 RepID=A0ABS4MEI3_9LACO|nr:elongation factor P [Lactobacillus colini]MBP2058076.1 elongation factor P [Lactobacillus colini]